MDRGKSPPLHKSVSQKQAAMSMFFPIIDNPRTVVHPSIGAGIQVRTVTKEPSMRMAMFAHRLWFPSCGTSGKYGMDELGPVIKINYKQLKCLIIHN